MVQRLVAIGLMGLVMGCAAKAPKKDYSVTACIADLNDANADVRATAASVLGKYGAEAGPAVPALTKLLRDANRKVRICAVYALAGIGPDARPSIPALRQALNDQDRDVRDGAKYALKQLQRKS